MENHSSRFTGTSTVSAAKGWAVSRITPPSALFGANGMRVGPDGRLYVAQAFGSQVSAIDVQRRRDLQQLVRSAVQSSRPTISHSTRAASCTSPK